jgi:tRNA-2-methylthio-N6-dimethylallyladenosine synthase
MKVFIETMGCQMNRLDSELLVGSLRAAGHEIVQDQWSADAVIYNTCSVRRHAEQKVLSRLGADGQRKASGRKLIVAVVGCMAQRMGESLRQQYPAVDIVCGPGRLYRLPELLADAAAGGTGVALDPARNEPPDPAAEARMDELDLGRDPASGAVPSQAFVRVMRGCDFFCSYCVVPFVRGPERSRSPDHIAQEVRRLVEAGRTEITLLGQTVNSYNWSGGGRRVRFSDLLERTRAVAGLRRLRFVTSHPIDFGDDVLQAMRDLPNVCPYIHVPAQSGSDAVLKRMNRRYTRARYDDLIDRARAIVPGVVLAGDFIVGFPGETEQDHAASAELIRRCGYKNSFVFKYSPRPGTAAAERFKDDVPMEVKKRRNNELLAVQAEVGLAHHRQYVGRTVEVLVEGPSPRAGKQPRPAREGEVQLVGRTRGDHIVVFDGPPGLAGRYVDVRITDATSLTLMGEGGHEPEGGTRPDTRHRDSSQPTNPSQPTN